MKARVAIEAQDILGEGPVWSPDEQALYWVDIHKHVLQRWDFNTRNKDAWNLPSDIGSFALRGNNEAVVALRTGFAILNLSNGKVNHLKKPNDLDESTRFNDGKCDRLGRFWAGTMNEEDPSKLGSALYRLDKSQHCEKVLGDIGISNGLGWSPDNNVFYYTDSAQRVIWTFDYDIQTGKIFNRKIFTHTPQDHVPDGLTVDSAGFVWSAKWDGWKVVRYSPDGAVDTEVILPIQRPTSCMFGGPEMNMLFVTSARIGLSSKQLQTQPLAGNVFVIDTNIVGLPEFKYEG